MNDQEITKEILVAAINSGMIKTSGGIGVVKSDSDLNIEVICKAYKEIFATVQGR